MSHARPVALVTGAARRVGRAIALELAGAGWDVAVHCRHSRDGADATRDAAVAAGARAEVMVADLADPAACEALAAGVVVRFGRLDAVVNNASLFEFDSALAFDPVLAARHHAINAVAPVILARAVHADVRRRGGRGAVVNLLDQKLDNPNPDHLSYTLSKAALREATILLAQALAPAVRVNAVSPGLTLPSGPMNDAEFARAAALSPLGRAATPAEIAAAVRFLLTAEAVTGAILPVDAGQHLARQERDVLFLVRSGQGEA